MLMNAGYAYSSNAIFTTPIGAFTTANSTDVNPMLPYKNVLGVIPTLSFTGSNSLTNLGSTGIYHDINENHNVFGDVTKTLGRHTLITGERHRRQLGRLHLCRHQHWHLPCCCRAEYGNTNGHCFCQLPDRQRQWRIQPGVERHYG
jgi:hypothetical protein